MQWSSDNRRLAGVWGSDPATGGITAGTTASRHVVGEDGTEKDNHLATAAMIGESPLGSAAFGRGPWDGMGGPGGLSEDALRIVLICWIGATLVSALMWIVAARLI